MFPYKYENISKFYNVLSLALEDKVDWDDLTVSEVKGFILSNLSLMIKSENVTFRQFFQEELLKLSDKINEKFSNPSARNLAFEIMGIAQGIFSKEEKIDFTLLLPPDIQQKIHAELIASREDLIQNKIISGLEPVRLVSKTELKIADETKIAWINNEILSLKASGCNTIQQALDYIKKNQNLYNANLSEFYKLTNRPLA